MINLTSFILIFIINVKNKIFCYCVYSVCTDFLKHLANYCTVLFTLVFISEAAAAAKSLQSCQTLCNPTDGGPPGSTIPGILQARTLEWVSISFSNAGK